MKGSSMLQCTTIVAARMPRTAAAPLINSAPMPRSF